MFAPEFLLREIAVTIFKMSQIVVNGVVYEAVTVKKVEEKTTRKLDVDNSIGGQFIGTWGDFIYATVGQVAGALQLFVVVLCTYLCYHLVASLWAVEYLELAADCKNYVGGTLRNLSSLSFNPEPYLEKFDVALFTAMATWVQLVVTLHVHIYTLFRWVMHGVFTLLRAFSGKTQLLLERAIAGSTPQPFNVQKYQCEIQTTSGQLIGQIFRTQVGGADVLVTACHCVEEPEMNLVSGSVKVLVYRDDFIRRPLSDVAFLPYSGKLSVLSLSKGKIAKLGSLASATIVSRGKGTIGSVTPLQEFGKVGYSATTLAGYSGAPYCFGNAIYGVHLGSAGGVNFGIEGSYLELLITGDVGDEPNCSFPEDSEDYLLHRLTKGEKATWKATGDPDRVTVRMGGKYYSIDKDTELGGKIWSKITSTVESIPVAHLPQVQMPTVSDQSNGSFLGQRQLTLRPVDSPPVLQACPTPPIILDTPQIVNLVTTGQEQTMTPSGDRLTSTLTSPPVLEKNPNRDNMMRCLLNLYSSLSAGDQQMLALKLSTPVSNAGLAELLSKLSPTSTSRLA